MPKHITSWQDTNRKEGTKKLRGGGGDREPADVVRITLVMHPVSSKRKQLSCLLYMLFVSRSTRFSLKYKNNSQKPAVRFSVFLTRCSELTHWRGAVKRMISQRTGDVISRRQPDCVGRPRHRIHCPSILEPNVRQMTAWAAAAVTQQLHLYVILTFFYTGHLHLQSWM